MSQPSLITRCTISFSNSPKVAFRVLDGLLGSMDKISKKKEIGPGDKIHISKLLGGYVDTVIELGNQLQGANNQKDIAELRKTCDRYSIIMHNLRARLGDEFVDEIQNEKIARRDPYDPTRVYDSPLPAYRIISDAHLIIGSTRTR